MRSQSCEPGPELPVERAQPGGELPGRGLASKLRADPLHDLREPNGVEPDVGIERLLPLLALAELEALEQVDRRVVALGGVFERGLEALAQVEDEVGVADALDVAHRELDIVRLGSRRGEVRDLDAIAADLGGGECQRIEAGDDVRATVGRTRCVAAAAGDERADRRGQ